jgi:hypothetical protein
MRWLGYLWAFPVTLAGVTLALLSLASGGGARCRGGVLEAWGGLGGRLLRGGALHSGGAAVTLGHVILARDAVCLARSRPHELVHVRQYECWGPLLLPVYWSVSAWLWWRGHHPYLDHPLEPPPA